MAEGSGGRPRSPLVILGIMMKVYQIRDAITENVTPEALEHFNGMDDESINELVVIAQRESVEAAAKELEAWANPQEANDD